MNQESSPLSDPINRFTCDLFHQICSSADGQENVFLSPFSVSTALSMLLLGARNRSEEQMRHTMHFSHMEEDVHHLFHELMKQQVNRDDGLLLANSVIFQKTEDNDTVTSFKHELLSKYSANAQDVDFGSEAAQVQASVNDWVSGKTNGLIKKMMSDPPSPDTILILLNAIYFRGKWEKQFDAKKTKKIPFFNNGENEIETDFMVMTGKDHNYTEMTVAGHKSQILEMDYELGRSMVIVLPQERNGLKCILSSDSFTHDLRNLCLNLETHKTRVNVFVPKFQFETEYKMNHPLIQMGFTDIFSANDADLSGINGSGGLFVSEVKHKAMVKVDESGTEAAAATSVTIMKRCIVMSKEFVADHPFLFLIKDKESGIVLFIGKVESL